MRPSLREISKRDVMLGIVGRRQVGLAGQLHQVAVAGLVLGQQCERRHAAKSLLGSEAPLLRRIGHVHLDGAADDRLDALVRHGLGELERAEEIAGVGDRNRGHARVLGQLRQFLDLQRPFRQRVGGMGAEMDEAHAGRLG